MRTPWSSSRRLSPRPPKTTAPAFYAHETRADRSWVVVVGEENSIYLLTFVYPMTYNNVYTLYHIVKGVIISYLVTIIANYLYDWKVQAVYTIQCIL